jgi:hypothetical protein
MINNDIKENIIIPGKKNYGQMNRRFTEIVSN